MDGKKLLVFSDSHGERTVLKAVFNWAKELLPPNGKICAAACCGDSLSDISKCAEASGFYSDWKLVCGNNDYGVHAPEAAVFDFADHKFFLCHGHRHGSYHGYHTLLAAANNNEADIALFGHSHVPFYKVIDGVTLINPGSIGRPRSRIGATFAVIECPEGQPVIVEFFGIGNEYKIKKVKI